MPLEAVATTVEAAWGGLALLVTWPNLLCLVAGTLIAMSVAALPGVSGSTLMAIAIPLTFSWEPVPLMVLFGALVGGGTFMGSVTAILLNIPGTAPNAATALDGYPLTQQGRAREAIGCSATASALGSSVGILALIVMLPFVSRVLAFVGPTELLVLAVWGLLSVATVIRASVLKGLIVAGLGLMVSFAGLDPVSAEARYTFGTLYLQDGFALVPVFIGIFAVAEIIDLVASGRARVADRAGGGGLHGSLTEGVRSVFRHPGLFLKSSLIGTGVGVMPGLGGTVAAFVAYGEARRSAGASGRFGQGDIRGVLAPEAANDAKDGGSLLPALAFGIPASAGTALLIAALQIHGIRPGAELLQQRLDLAFVLIWSLFLSNWITSIVGLGLARPMVALADLRTSRLASVVLVLAAVGAMSYRGSGADVAVAFAFGVIGYAMKRHGWPRIAFVIAFILGPLVEVNLHLALSLHALGRINLWTKPTVIAGAGLVLVTVLAPRWLRLRGRAA